METHIKKEQLGLVTLDELSRRPYFPSPLVPLLLLVKCLVERLGILSCMWVLVTPGT